MAAVAVWFWVRAESLRNQASKGEMEAERLRIQAEEASERERKAAEEAKSYQQTAEKNLSELHAQHLLKIAQQFSYGGVRRDLFCVLVTKALKLDKELRHRLPPEIVELLMRLRPGLDVTLLDGLPSVRSIALDFHGDHVAAIDWMGKAYVRGVKSPSTWWKPLDPKTDHVFTCVSFHRALGDKGGLLATGTSKGEVLLWKAQTGEQSLTDNPLNLTSSVTAVAFSTNSGFIAAAAQDGTAVVWDLDTGRRRCSFKADLGYYTALVPHIRGKLLAAVDSSGRVHLWDASEGNKLLGEPLVGEVVDAAFDNFPDEKHGGPTLATITRLGRVVNWRLTEGKDGWKATKLVGEFSTGSYGNNPPVGVRFSPDGKHLLAWRNRDTLGVWDASTGKPRYTTPPIQTGYRQAAAISTDGKRLVVAYHALYPEQQEQREALRAVLTVSLGPAPFLQAALLAWPIAGPLLGVSPLNVPEVPLDEATEIDLALEVAARTRYPIQPAEYVRILNTVQPEKGRNLQTVLDETKLLDAADETPEQLRQGPLQRLKQALDVQGFADAAGEAKRLFVISSLDAALASAVNGQMDQARRFVKKAQKVDKAATFTPAMLARWGRGSAVGLMPDKGTKTADDVLREIEADNHHRRGVNHAAAGEDKAARAEFGIVKELQKNAGVPEGARIDPKGLARRLTAEHYQRRANLFAAQFKISETTLALRRAMELNPDVCSDPAVEARRLVAQRRRRSAEILARQGNVEAAEAEFARARSIDETLAIDPRAEARRLAAPWLRQQARAAADRLEIEQALDLFRKAAQFDPSLKIKPDDEVRQAWLKKVQILVTRGKVREAVDLMKRLAEKYGKSLDPVAFTVWNELCWFGTLYGEADLVAEYGEKAVASAEARKDGRLTAYYRDRLIAYYRDTRGVNRAVRSLLEEARKDFEAARKLRKGALEDFEADLQWRHKQPKGSTDAHIKTRQEWVRQLEKGVNPFADKRALEELLNE
jgi:tetratricopeptide (TPR) repeat protein